MSVCARLEPDALVVLYSTQSCMAALSMHALVSFSNAQCTMHAYALQVQYAYALQAM